MNAIRRKKGLLHNILVFHECVVLLDKGNLQEGLYWSRISWTVKSERCGNTQYYQSRHSQNAVAAVARELK